MNQKMILISIKPEFVEKILSGEKTIELRKSLPNASEGDILIIYSTSPVKAVVGFCTIEQIITQNPSTFWAVHQTNCGIDKKRFFEYFQNYNRVIGIKLSNTQKLPEAIDLQIIRKKWPKFTPPQTYKYLSTKEVLHWYSSGRKGQG